MLAEVIAIGDELTSGQRLDTNSQWLSRRLAELGIKTAFHTTVADDLDACIQVFQHAIQRADCILVTGGLGPTQDDLTRQSLAAACGVELAEDADSLEHIRGMYKKRGREMPESNKVQALFPVGSAPIPNPHGTAPGIQMECQHDSSKAWCFAMPGVPAEMREMWEETVAPRLLKLGGSKNNIIRHYVLRCFGVGESDLEQRLPDLIRRGRKPSVGITVSQATITLRITAEGRDEAECQELVQPTIATIHECLGNLVFGEDDDELQHAVLRLLSEQELTLASCEFGTNGLVGRWLSEVDAEGTQYLGGWIHRDVDKALTSHGDDEEELPEVEDSPTADLEELAELCRRQHHADLAILVGPFSVQDVSNSSDSRVAILLATPMGTIVHQPSLAGHPAIVEARAAKQSLDLVRHFLLEAE